MIAIKELITNHSNGHYPETQAALGKSIELSIVMPCLNEEETLESCIRAAFAGLKATGIAGEVIIADNGSQDESLAIAARYPVRVIHVQHRGYGAALSAGIAAARGRYVIMADSDNSYDLSQIQGFVTELRAGQLFVCGTRFRGKIDPDAMPWLHRYLGTPVLTFLGNMLFHTKLSDYQCGMRGFDRQSVADLSLRTPGMEFATEMIAKAALHHLSITEVPIDYRKDGRSRPPHLRTWEDGWRHLRFMVLLSPAWVFLYPGLVLGVISLVGLLLLLPGPVSIGTVTLDIHTLLVFGISLIISAQLLAFWLSARLFAYAIGLLPAQNRLFQLVGNAPFRVGITLGGALFVSGLVMSIHAFGLWSSVQFGSLNYEVALRWLIPGLVMLTLSVHIFFSSFITSLLNFTENWAISSSEPEIEEAPTPEAVVHPGLNQHVPLDT